MFKKLLFILKGYILWVWYYLYKPYRDLRKSQASCRMTICRNCDCFCKKSGRCSLCGCVMEVETKMYLDEEHQCPEKKWK
jgi:hypothetical protein